MSFADQHYSTSSSSTTASALDGFVLDQFNSTHNYNDLGSEFHLLGSYLDYSMLDFDTSTAMTIEPHLLHQTHQSLPQQQQQQQQQVLSSCTFPSLTSAATTATTTTPSVTAATAATVAVKTESSAMMLTPSSSEEGFFTRHLSPSTSEGSLSSYDDDDMDYDEEEEEEEEEGGVMRAAPSIRVIENKPRRGGRRKKDIRPREEQLLPPASPRTMNDEDLMAAYKQERNRLAAKRSRERKKGYVQELEETCQALKSHNDELSRELLRLKRDLKKRRSSL